MDNVDRLENWVIFSIDEKLFVPRYRVLTLAAVAGAIRSRVVISQLARLSLFPSIAVECFLRAEDSNTS
jgi:hypothetical protein